MTLNKKDRVAKGIFSVRMCARARRRVSSPQALVPRVGAARPGLLRDNYAQGPIRRVAPPEGPLDSRRQSMAQDKVVRPFSRPVYEFTPLGPPPAQRAVQVHAPVDDVSSHHDGASREPRFGRGQMTPLSLAVVRVNLPRDTLRAAVFFVRADL